MALKNQSTTDWSRKVEQGTIVALVLGAASFAFWLGGISNTLTELKQKQAEPEKLLPIPKKQLDALVASLQTAQLDQNEWLKQIPVGTILPMYLEGDEDKAYEHIPRSWVLCDGKVLNSDHPRKFTDKEVDHQLWNRATPNLDGRFLRGANSQFPNGTLGGSDLLPKHVHGLPAHTGPVSETHEDPEKTAEQRGFWVRAGDKKEFKPGVLRASHANPNNGEGQHSHFFGVPNTFDKPTGSAETPEIIPRFVAVRFIIRVK